MYTWGFSDAANGEPRTNNNQSNGIEAVPWQARSSPCTDSHLNLAAAAAANTASQSSVISFLSDI